MLIAAALVVPLLIIENEGGSWHTAAVLLNWVVWLAFVVEAVVMLNVVDDRGAWLRQHPLEVLVVLLTGPFVPSSLQAVRAVRLLRLLRLLVLAKRIRRLLEPGGLSHSAVVSLLTVIAGGAALRTVEPDLHLSFADSTWWALTTATTVGYGDISPGSTAGRIIAAVVMLVGIGFVALLTAALAREFVEPAETEIASKEDEILAALRAIQERLDSIERSS